MKSCIYSLFVSHKQKISSKTLFHTSGFFSALPQDLHFSTFNCTFAIKMLAKATAILVPVAVPYLSR